MCFSAEASFTAGAVLLSAGAYCLRTAARLGAAYLPLAAVPIAFGVQQLAEGLVWLGLAHDDPALVRPISLVYLFFALAFWPFWVPLCVVCLEQRPRVRRILAVGTLLGVALGAAQFVPLLFLTPWLKVEVVHHSIHYHIRNAFPFNTAPRLVWMALYAALVFCPFLAARDSRFTGFGLSLIASVAVSELLFSHAFVSVWCFFAALLSLQLCHLFHRLAEPRLA